MQVTVDTTAPLTDTDRAILRILTGAEETAPTAAAPVTKAAPKAKPVKAKAAPKEVEEETVLPEPMAEEPLLTPEEEPEEANPDTGEEDAESLRVAALKKATELVEAGRAADVRAALDAAGASRVRELTVENVRAFFKALP